MEIDEILKIEKVRECVKITNNSPFDLIISEKPIPPKRKYINRVLIKTKQCIIFDHPIDLTTISFSFVEYKLDAK